MYGQYFNFGTHIAKGAWDRRAFLRKVWRIYGDDPRWIPPAHTKLLRSLQPGRYAHMDRADATLLSVEALQRSSHRMSVSGGGSGAMGVSGSIFELPVVAVALLTEPRRHDRTVYLGLFRFVNDDEVLERLMGILMEELWRSGCRRIVGPTGLSPRLECGALRDCFDQTPPLGTPYNPPYVPDLLDQSMQPLHQSRLYHATVPAGADLAPYGSAAMEPISPSRLSGELLPLYAEAFGREDNMPVIDEAEAAFMLDWVQTWPSEFWLATINGEAAGFLALQPNLARMVRRANGGRNPLWLPWLKWRQRRPAKSGRLLHLAVAQDWRGRGLGRQLWNHALARAHALGWRNVTIGPVIDETPASAFLRQMGAAPRQHYTTYAMNM